MKYIVTILLSFAGMFLYLKLTPEQKQEILGKLRSSGISIGEPAQEGHRPDQPDDAVSAVESSQPTSQPEAFSVPADWLKGDAKKRKRLAYLESSQKPPALQVTKWRNSVPLHPGLRRGKIVVLTFWATWCPPCLKSIEVNNDIYQQYKNDDVLFIGICNTSGGEKMEDIIEEYGIQYPVAVDEAKRTAKSYQVAAYPSYFIIDANGKLRFADLKRYRVQEAIEGLLNE